MSKPTLSEYTRFKNQKRILKFQRIANVIIAVALWSLIFIYIGKMI